MAETPAGYPQPEDGPVFVESATVPIGGVRAVLGRLGLRGAEVEPSEAGPAEPLADVLDSIGEDGTATQLDGEDPRAQQLVRSYFAGPHLEKPLYLNRPDGIGNYTKIASIRPSAGKPVELPAADFVAAPGLTGWAGEGRMKDDRGKAVDSAKVIRGYARKGTDGMPGIGIVFAYSQPNGLTFFEAVQDGAHRIAAAKARGASSIPVMGSIEVCRLERDILPLPSQESAG